MRISRLQRFAAFIGLILATTSACTSISQATMIPDQTNQTNISMGSSSFYTAKSIKELVDKSTIIVSGKAIAQKEIINMARNVNDISHPDPNILGVGQVYQFEIDRYFKGSGQKTIYVVQLEGFLSGDRVGLTLVDANIKTARSQFKHIPIRLNTQFILFLEPLVGFKDLKNYYTGSINPWRFDVSNSDQTIPESPWDGARQAFPPRQAAILINQIEHPDQIEASFPTEQVPYPINKGSPNLQVPYP